MDSLFWIIILALVGLVVFSALAGDISMSEKWDMTSKPDESLTVLEPQQLTSPEVTRNIQALLDYYDPKRGRLSSWWQRGKAESRVKFLEVTNQEQRLVIERGAILESAIRQGQKDNAEFRVFIAKHAHTLLELKHSAVLIEQAMAGGLSVETDQEVKKARLLSDIKVEEEERLLTARLKDHIERAKIAIQNRWEEITQDLNAADQVQMGELQLLNKEREYLAQEVRGRYQLMKGDDDQAVKDELVKDYDQHIAFLKRRINDRQTGLLLSTHGQEVKGLEAGEADSPGRDSEKIEGGEEQIHDTDAG